MTVFLISMKSEKTSQLIAFRKEFEDNYDNVEYLKDLAVRVGIYNNDYPVREGYLLLDEIDERIMELQDGI